MQNTAKEVDALISCFKQYLIQSKNDLFLEKGTQILSDKLNFFVKQSLPILMLLPGFPFKSPNTKEKASGSLPDYGELSSIKHLESMCIEMEAIYPQGVQLTILSDGTTFNDIIGVSDEQRATYNRALREIHSSEHIVWRELSDMLNFEGSATNTRKQLISQAKLPFKNFANFVNRAQIDEKLSAKHDNMCSFLYNDLRLARTDEMNNDGYMDLIRQKSYEMMWRGMALDSMIDKTFPDHVRLSLHQYNNAGPKFTVNLLSGLTKAKSPWHNICVRKLDGTLTFLTNKEVQSQNVIPIQRENKLWLYQELSAPLEQALTFEVIHGNEFGILISANSNDEIHLHTLPEQLLHSLVKQFSFVCLRSITSDNGQIEELMRTHFDNSSLAMTENNPNYVTNIPSRIESQTTAIYCKDKSENANEDGEILASHTVTIVNTKQILSSLPKVLLKDNEKVGVVYQQNPSTVEPIIGTSPTAKEANLFLEIATSENPDNKNINVTLQGDFPETAHPLRDALQQQVTAKNNVYSHHWQCGDLLILDRQATLSYSS